MGIMQVLRLVIKLKKMSEHLNGWIKLHRSILDWEWFKDAETLQLFIYCLVRANLNDGSWRNIDYKRGEFITSLESISKDTGLTIQQTRTRLKRLISTGEITCKSTNKFTIITICKFDDYQNIFESTNKQTNRQATDNQQTKVDESNKQLTTGREDEEDNRIRRERNKEKISYKDIKKKDDDFIAPTLTDVRRFILENDLTGVSPEEFYQYYEECDWKQGKRKMKDWKAVVKQWNQRNFSNSNKFNSSVNKNGISTAEYGIVL